MAEWIDPGPNPTNADLAAGLRTLHNCTEEQVAATKREFGKIRAEMARDRKKANQTRAVLTSRQEKIITALGLNEDGEKQRKPIALWTPRKALTWLTTFGGLMLILAKLINAAWPGLVTAAHAVWQAVIR